MIRPLVPCLSALSVALLAALVPVAPGIARDYLLVQSGTTLRDSGFFDAVLPAFGESAGLEVRVVAVGTGQAIRNAERGDADLLFTHWPQDEERFVREGRGLERRDVMYNRFVLVGPPGDPAEIEGSRDVVASVRRIADTESLFASRGDDSGTHKAELRFWTEAGVDVGSGAHPWYRSLGAGMGATLNAGIAMGAYVLTDEATWLAFSNKGEYRILVERDPRMHNQYGVVLVKPLAGRENRLELARSFFDWIVSEAGQARIACFRIAGEQAFVPDREVAVRDCGE